MFKNYLKTLWRNMQKNKLHTAINVIGMAVAFTCSILLMVMVYNEFSFDKFHDNKSKLYKLYTFGNTPEGLDLSASMGYPAAATVKSENIGIVKSTRIRNRGGEIRYKEKSLDQSTLMVDDDFFSMFSFPVVKGAKEHPLAGIDNIVLNEKTAGNLFGDEDPIGKKVEVKIGGQWIALSVSAVLKDAPLNSSIRFSALARTEADPSYAELKNDWNSQHHSVYVQLAANTTQAQVENQLRNFTKKYNPTDVDFLKKKGYRQDANGDYTGMKILPIEELHFSAALGTGNSVSKSFLYILLLVAFVIILIACFNFVNLNIGLSFTRTKEIGIRKCLGAGKRQVWMQVWGESFITVLASMLIAIGATMILMSGFNKLMEAKFDISLLYQPSIIFYLVVLLLLVSLIASGYPSFIMGKLKTVEILKGKISLKKPGIFRNALIVAQFVIAIVLICTTVIIYQQFQHLRKAPLGYTTESLVSIPLKKYEKGKEIVSKLRTMLASQSGVVSITGSDVNLGMGQDNSTSRTSFGFDYNGKSIGTDFMAADYDILKTLNIPVKQGRDFSTSYVADSSTSVIVTESMAKQLGEGNVVGLSFYADSSKPKWTVVGVIPDFHLYSMYEKNDPLTISMNSTSFISYALIRVNTQNPTATMDIIKNAFAQVQPGEEFKGSYVTENIDRWYTNEKRLSSMFSIASMVAIILSCMGLFGMAFIIIRQRVKEIGVRKVLGASVSGIATLVTKEFIKPVIIALVIATPIAWWAMHKWLQDFSYRVDIQWWIFIVAGVVAVMIAILTVSFHAIKAAVANPVKSLRTE
ncbi:ABC transporter permease [Ferruginibacter sp. SUN106]|uniref:ABC transporter permease n=1 Tax=Ferruginibacter sp. SUN106 TaxID=2978348 RepID=UPI003D367A7D